MEKTCFHLFFAAVVFSLCLSRAYCEKKSSTGGCSAQLNGGLPKKEPLYLRLSGKNVELFHPEGPTIELKKNEQLLIACSGSNNYITPLKNSSSVAYGRCRSKDVLYFGKKSFPISEIACDKTMTGDIVTTKDKCEGDGTWSNIGFDVRDSQVGFVPLYRVCYDQNTGSVIYTEHTIFGTSIADGEKESYRPSFKSAGTPKHVSPAKAYTQEAQKEMFTELLGSSELSEKYFEGANAFLARGHMSPDADFTFAIWQYATYFYVNVCPQWQAVNAGNWLRVENLARKLGSSRGEDLTIYSGVHEILTLPDINGNEVKMFIAPGGNVFIPKWNWKIVYSQKTGEGIAFVTLNNPYAEKVMPKELLCKSVCQEAGFEDTNFENLTRGYTYCCTVEDLREAVKTAPKVDVKKMMKA